MSQKTGYLEVIIGPMFSSKTTTLLEIYKRCKFCNISVAVINHSVDCRYDDNLLSSHDEIKIPCIKTDKLFNLWSDYVGENYEDEDAQLFADKYVIATSDVILINEGQFFEDLYDFVNKLLKKGKKIYVCGLDGDFERKKFGQILDLIPLCDKVNKLSSLCSLCRDGTPGIFSMRLTDEKEQTLVGSSNYIPVCRKCYSEKHV
jgi:thymidine kinase